MSLGHGYHYWRYLSDEQLKIRTLLNLPMFSEVSVKIGSGPSKLIF